MFIVIDALALPVTQKTICVIIGFYRQLFLFITGIMIGTIWEEMKNADHEARNFLPEEFSVPA
jgi:hypothetical protein